MTSSRSRRSAKDAGTRFETSVARWLAEHVDDRIERRARNGEKDRGDLSGLRTAHGRVVSECKDTTRIELAQWASEAETERGNDDALAGLTIHKRRGVADPSQQWVTMTLADLAALLTGHQPEDPE